jgi:hypothetical protein
MMAGKQAVTALHGGGRPRAPWQDGIAAVPACWGCGDA